MKEYLIYMILLLLLTMISVCTSGQERDTVSKHIAPKDTCLTHIYLDEYNLFLYGLKTNETIKEKLNNDKGFVKILLDDCMGAMTLRHFNSDSLLISEGYYIRSLDTLKEYKSLIEPKPPYKTNVHVFKYFQPLKHGPWRFWDEENKEYYVEYREYGVLQY